MQLRSVSPRLCWYACAQHRMLVLVTCCIMAHSVLCQWSASPAAWGLGPKALTPACSSPGLCTCPSQKVRCHLVLQEPSSIEKILEIDEHMGCAMSGLTADAKMLVDHARAETQVRHIRMQLSLMLLSSQHMRGSPQRHTSSLHIACFLGRAPICSTQPDAVYTQYCRPSP